MRTKTLKYLANNALGALALFIALGGVGYAATGGFVSGGKLQACVSGNGSLTLLKAGKHCRRGQKQIAWNQTGPQGPPGGSGVAGANGATVPSANTANNALALGGIPASGYTRNDCVSTTGQVKGFALIPTGLPFEVFTKLAGAYNCSGQGVEVKRTGEGDWVVRFPGSPALIAIATANTPELGKMYTADVHRLGPGEWQVQVFRSQPPAAFEDEEVELLVP
jgi:hypothetical protein